MLLLLSHFSRVQLCATPQMEAHQAPPSLGFSRQEHWSGLPFPSPMQESEKLFSRVQLLATPWTAAYQAPPSMGFSRQEYWSGCHCLLQGNLIPPVPFFFLQSALAIQGLLCFHMNSEIFCSSSVKNTIGNWIGIALNLQIAFGNIVIFTILIVWQQCTRPEKAMAPQSSPLAQKIPWTEKPGGLQSMGSLRVEHD